MQKHVAPYRPAEQISLIKLSDDEIAEIIRPEKNLERMSSYIFPLPSAFPLREERTLVDPYNQGEELFINGKKLETKLTITPSVSHDSYTYKSYPVYKAVLAIWSEQGMPDKPFFTSFSAIAKKMGVSRGGRYLREIEKELDSLYYTNISWVLCFEGEEPRGTLKNKRILEIFNFNRLNERIDDTNQFDAEVELQLGYFLRNQHKAGQTIPVNWTTLKAITSPSIRIIFNQIDSLLAVHSIHERKLLGLIEELHLTASRYKYKSQRKAFADKIKQQLNGKRLSSLKVLSVQIEETASGEDYKCIFRSVSDDNYKALELKKASNAKKRKKQKVLPVVNADTSYCEYLASEIASVAGEAEKNKALYLKYARHYSETLIFRVIGYVKESKNVVGTTIENPGAYFTDNLHRIAHESGLDWITDCGTNCHQKAENRLPGT